MPEADETGAIEGASRVTSAERLGELHDAPRENVLRIQQAGLDRFTREFISLSPLVMIGSEGSVSSKGDQPGFVQILDDRTLLIPERAGNNRLDTTRNLLDNPSVGLLFLIPGVNEVLRVGGTAELTDDPAVLAPLAVNGNAPKIGILVRIERVFYNCARSLLRSKAWDPATHLDRRAVPSPAQVLARRSGDDPDEMNQNYERHMGDLYANH